MAECERERVLAMKLLDKHFYFYFICFVCLTKQIAYVNDKQCEMCVSPNGAVIDCIEKLFKFAFGCNHFLKLTMDFTFL